ncbi:MAG: pyridoxal kinase [Pseudomonadota bacterium]
MAKLGAPPVCLTLQSHVVAGHVGLGAAIPVLAMSGVEPWPLPTVILSGHAGVPGVRRAGHGASDIVTLIEGLEGAGALRRVDALLSGYMASPDAVGAVLGLRDALSAAAPQAVWIADPVLGDNGHLYVPQPVAERIRDDLVPRADILTPNTFEVSWLTAMPVGDPGQIDLAAQALLAKGPRAVFVTSVEQDGGIGILAATETGAWIATAPKLNHRINGGGDVTAALLTASWLAGRSPADAIGQAVATLSVLAQGSADLNRDDLPVCASPAQILSPPPPVEIRQLR